MANIVQGTVFGGRYTVQSQVGSGGMATVYRGVDNVLDRQVAIKVMLPQYANDPAFAARFKQEAQAAAALQNPYIVQVYDWGRDELTGTYYIVMEYLRGTDLKTGIRSHGALAPRKVAQIGAQVCSALAVAHAHDIIHRDIKPQNIMIQPNGDAKVMDFGIARAKNSHLTQTNSVLGTAHYVSPEQAQGKDLGPTSDLYSLGVVMYEAATGKLPFEGDDAVAVALKQVNEQPVPPSQINPNVDDNLETIILTCMAKDPSQRFQTADELRRVLNNYIVGKPLGIAQRTTVMAGTTTRLGATKTTPLAGTTGQTARMPANGRTGTVAMVRETDNRTQRRDPQGSGQFQAERQGVSGGVIAGVVVAVIAVIALVVVFAVANCSGNNRPAQESDDKDAQQTATVTQDSEKVSVPSLSGLTEQQAENRLESFGLELGSVTEEASSTVAKGKVISQSPTAKTEVAKGTRVNIIISSGADTVTITDIRGKTEQEAQESLEAQGLTGTHDASLDAYSNQYPENTVCVYQLADKTKSVNAPVEKGTEVRYGLSKGVDPATLKTTMPTVVGSYYTDAEAAITAAELNYYEAWDYNDASWGTVISADYDAGTELDKQTTVTIHISNGPAPVEINGSAYYGWSSSAVSNDLSSRGLYANVVTGDAAPDPSSEGMVYAVDSGTYSAGETVNVYVYGPYVQPNVTIPGNIASSGNAGSVVSQLQGLGFYNISVVDTSGASVSGYDSYTVSSVSYAGASVSPDTAITVVVNVPATPEPTPDPGEEGTTTTDGEDA